MQDFCLVVTPHTYVKAKLKDEDGMAAYIKDIDTRYEALCREKP